MLGVPKVKVQLHADHAYTINSVRVRGVTSLLRDSGISSSWMPDKYFLDRGTYVHLSLALAAAGNLDEDSLPHAYKGFVMSGLRMLTCRAKDGLAVPEVKVGSKIGLFCGTLDVVFPNEHELWDYKTGPKKPWDKLQVAAYRIALRETYGIKVRKTLGVYLQADGSNPKVEEYNDKGDEAKFMSIVNFMRTYDEIHPRRAKNGHDIGCADAD